MIIDPEFRELIPSLTAEEYKDLEKSILADGCRDALVLWEDTLVDGHNRHRICSLNNIPFNTISMEFNSRNDAMEWIIRNQFARRNLPPYERTRLMLKLEDSIKARAKENQVRKPEFVSQNSVKQKIDTQKELAKLAGVSHDTVAKVKKIEKMATLEQKERLSNGKVSINKVYKEIVCPEKTTEPEKVVESEKKKCTVCGFTLDVDQFSKGTVCNQCKSYIASCKRKGYKLDVEELKQMDFSAVEAFYNQAVRNTPRGDQVQQDLDEKELPVGIIAETLTVLNSCHIDINKFAFMADLALAKEEDKKELLAIIEFIAEDLTKIKKILEDESND